MLRNAENFKPIIPPEDPYKELDEIVAYWMAKINKQFNEIDAMIKNINKELSKYENHNS